MLASLSDLDKSAGSLAFEAVHAYVLKDSAGFVRGYVRMIRRCAGPRAGERTDIPAKRVPVDGKRV
jgi:hypothetical protein